MQIMINKKWAGALIVLILIAAPRVIVVSAQVNYKTTYALDNPPDNPIHVTMIKEGGGRVSWSHSGNNLIAFDKKGADRYFDVYIMNPDGSNEICLTCNNPELPGKHMGNPEWHPTGKYIIFQAEKKAYPKINSYFTSPGVGYYNDLWVMTSDGENVWQLTNLTTTYMSSVLHPHFSHDGSKLLWGETLSHRVMALKIADFVVGESGPHLENITAYQPGSKHILYESHGFSPDDKTIIFTGSLEQDMHWTGMDIYTLSLETMELNWLTSTLDEWDEHAHYSPDGKKIVWSSSHGYPFDPNNFAKELRLELWIMDADGSNKTRLTHFNEPGYPEYTGVKTGVGDNSWNPDGTKIVFKLRESYEFTSKEKIGILEFIDEPGITITKPRYGYMYIFDREIMHISSDKSIIVGKITVETDAYGNIDKVEFYIDDVLKGTDAESPYEWIWDERTFGTHEIKVVAYDNEGNTAVDSQEVWIFNV